MLTLLLLSDTPINPIPPTVINIALLVLAAALGFVTKLYFTMRSNAATKLKDAVDDKKEIEGRLNTLEGQVALVNAAVVPISTAFQAILIKELTHFHTPEMDKLLAKIGPPNILTSSENDRLAVLLEARTRDLGVEISPSERDAAHILPAVMKRSQLEQSRLQLAEKLGLKLMTLTEVIGVPEHSESPSR